jgi:undecaprenyl-diphosphatase
MNFLAILDCRLFQIINSHHSTFFDAFFGIFTYLGNGWILTPILLVVAFFKVPRKRLPLYLVVFTIGMSASGIINSKIKQLTDTPRPLVHYTMTNLPCSPIHNKNIKVHVIGEALSFRSFPSGHTNTVFSAATLLALSLGGWFWFAYIPALVVGYSRIYVGAHFPSDVVGGALLAVIILICTNRIYFMLFKKLEKK